MTLASANETPRVYRSMGLARDNAEAILRSLGWSFYERTWVWCKEGEQPRRIFTEKVPGGFIAYGRTVQA